jgi:ferrous iron transport protein A
MSPVFSVSDQLNFSAAKEVRLSSLEPGAEVQVVSVEGTSPISRRLKEMGVVPGVSVRIVKTAPFGDPLEVRLLGYNLALRRSEADLVSVIGQPRSK